MEMSSVHMFKDLETLRLHLGLAMTTLLGHSNGGSIALGYAERYLERVQKTILLDHQLEDFDDSTTFKEGQSGVQRGLGAAAEIQCRYR